MADRYYKKIYSHRYFYQTLVLVMRSLRYLCLNRKTQLIAPPFRERIMLAVTEVNGCEACSYAHTKLALEKGLQLEEIHEILGGETQRVPEDELLGVIFAQHLTDQNGICSPHAWYRLVEAYGQEGAMVILSLTRAMNAANIYGMAVSALWDRLRKVASGKTRLAYELSIFLAGGLYLPIAAIHALIDHARKKTLYPFHVNRQT